MFEKLWIRKLNNESGFTLIELVISIAIVAVIAGISGFGLNAVFNANLKNIAYDISSDLRNIRYRSVAEFDTEYQLVLTYDASDDKYGYEIQKMEAGDLAPKVVKSEEYRSSLVIMRENSSGDWVELNDPSIDISNNPERGTFCFDTSTGGVSQYVLNSASVTVDSLNLNSNQLGKYKLVNTRNGEEIRFDVVRLTGRVVIYEI